jgi:hypothetical protein
VLEESLLSKYGILFLLNINFYTQLFSQYALRFVISPRPDILDFAGFRERLPTFEHSEEVQLTTDPYPLAAQETLSPTRSVMHQRSRSGTHDTGFTHAPNHPQYAPMGVLNHHMGPDGRDSTHQAARIQPMRPRTASAALS